MRHIRSLHFVRASLPVAFFALAALGLQAQDAVTIFGGGTTGSQTRIAAADFKPASPDAKTDELKHTFDTTLFNDLTNAGIFEMVSKSVAPPVQPGSPAEINLAQWSSAPANAAYVAFGSLAVNGAKLSVNGFLFDTKNPQFPSVLAKQYGDDASTDSARQIAHRFADEIILRLSGTPGIAETKIYYVHASGGNKEIWEMDYDGANQHQITHLGTISISPRVSPDNTRLVFSSLGRDGFQLKMYSLLLGRMVAFPIGGGTSLSPAWSPDGKTIAYSSSRSGDPEIYLTGIDGGASRRITNFKGPDVSPVFNPRTGAQIAWISGRTGLPQLYIMESTLRRPHGLPMANLSRSPGTASTAPAFPAARIST